MQKNSELKIFKDKTMIGKSNLKREVMFDKIIGKKKSKKISNKQIDRQNDEEKFNWHCTYCNKQGHT